MTDRGLPIVDGAPACPFVAFEDDRDGRAPAPDHRHRCFAEPRPAPRALAHQAAYCLSSAFPVCPTFQDWARREAAAARPVAIEDRSARDEPPVSRPMPPLEREPRHAPGTDTPPSGEPHRNPPRDWAAPPPWTGDEEPGPDDIPPPFLARAVVDDLDWGSDSRGLAGSAADRLAGPDPEAPSVAYSSRDAPAVDDPAAWYEEPAAPASGGSPPSNHQAARTVGKGTPAPPRRDQVHRRPEEEAAELFGPAWERPRRYEAYPSLRTRVGLPGLPGLPGISRLGVGILGLVLAGAVLFFIGPMLLGLGGGSPQTGADPTPSPTLDASASAEPTSVPAATPTVYVVAKGDTMSKIAKKYGLTVEQLQAANPQIKNANKIKVGDEIKIPPKVSPPAQGSASAAP